MSPTASDTPSSTACLTPSRIQEKKFIISASFLKFPATHLDVAWREPTDMTPACKGRFGGGVFFHAWHVRCVRLAPALVPGYRRIAWEQSRHKCQG